MGARRSVPGAQVSLDPRAVERTCSRCDGERVVADPRVRPVFTMEEALALLEGRELTGLGDALDSATTKLAIAVDRAARRASSVTCPTCGGTGVVTVLA